MTDPARHPSDEQLFDLVDGALDAARAASVGDHLDRCAACAAFVEAARTGEAAASELVEEMPADAVGVLDAAMRTAWRDRRDAISASERAADAAASPHDTSSAQLVDQRSTSGAARPARKVRRLVPILAFCVLALLAGASIQIGNGDHDSGSDPASTQESSTAITQESSQSGDAATASAPGAGATADSSVSSLDSDAAGEASRALPQISRGSDDSPVCIAVRDLAQLQLPDDRSVRDVHRGPLGIYVACG